MNELFKKIALLTTGLVIGVVVGRKDKTKKKFNAQVPILDLDAHSLQEERLLFVRSLLQV